MTDTVSEGLPADLSLGMWEEMAGAPLTGIGAEGHFEHGFQQVQKCPAQAQSRCLRRASAKFCVLGTMSPGEFPWLEHLWGSWRIVDSQSPAWTSSLESLGASRYNGCSRLRT